MNSQNNDRKNSDNVEESVEHSVKVEESVEHSVKVEESVEHSVKVEESVEKEAIDKEKGDLVPSAQTKQQVFVFGTGHYTGQYSFNGTGVVARPAFMTAVPPPSATTPASIMDNQGNTHYSDNEYNDGDVLRVYHSRSESESECSHLSDLSLPSVINQDIERAKSGNLQELYQQLNLNNDAEADAEEEADFSSNGSTGYNADEEEADCSSNGSTGNNADEEEADCSSNDSTGYYADNEQ